MMQVSREVRIETDDGTYVLTPTLAAMVRICNTLGSPRDALTRVSRLDFTAVAEIIAAGAGMNDKQAAKMQEAVFAYGISEVVGPVSEFIGMLINPRGKQDDEGDGEDSGND